MSQEVIELRNRTNEWFDYCVGNSELPSKAKKWIIIPLINKQKGNTTCWLLTAQEMDFTKFLTREWNRSRTSTIVTRG